MSTGPRQLECRNEADLLYGTKLLIDLLLSLIAIRTRKATRNYKHYRHLIFGLRLSTLCSAHFLIDYMVD